MKSVVIDITDALGVDAICRRLGVSRHAVRYARTEGMFPASWYAALDEMCAGEGVECPREAFNWKGAA